MNRRLKLTPPLFEVGPKAYMFGHPVLELAIRADELSRVYEVQIIFDPQYTDIPIIASRSQHLLVFAQHMDSLRPGRGMGSVLPEALRAAGAVGVILNHFERRLTADELERTMLRAEEVSLATMVCTDNVEQAVAVARLRPDIIVVESPELIAAGSGHDSTPSVVAAANAAIWNVNPDIVVIRGAGIGNAQDVYNVIASGSQGTGSSSAICGADDPFEMLERMIRATREAWDAIHASPAAFPGPL
jgi:triosephosphate isomerase